jgi:hypothetical protein
VPLIENTWITFPEGDEVFSPLLLPQQVGSGADLYEAKLPCPQLGGS